MILGMEQVVLADPMGGLGEVWKIIENPRHLIVFILWGIGYFCKQTPHVENWWIPWVLLCVGPVLSIAMSFTQADFTAIFSPTKLMQTLVFGGIWGMAYAIVAVFTYERFKGFLEKRQAAKDETKITEIPK